MKNNIHKILHAHSNDRANNKKLLKLLNTLIFLSFLFVLFFNLFEMSSIQNTFRGFLTTRETRDSERNALSIFCGNTEFCLEKKTEENFYNLMPGENLSYSIPAWAQSVRIELLPISSSFEYQGSAKSVNSNLLQDIHPSQAQVIAHQLTLQSGSQKQNLSFVSRKAYLSQSSQNQRNFPLRTLKSESVKNALFGEHADELSAAHTARVEIWSSTEFVVTPQSGSIELSNLSSNYKASNGMLVRVFVRETLTDSAAKESFLHSSYWSKSIKNLFGSQSNSILVQKSKLREQLVVPQKEGRTLNAISIDTFSFASAALQLNQQLPNIMPLSLKNSVPLKKNKSISLRPLSSPFTHVRVLISKRNQNWSNDKQPTLLASRDTGRSLRENLLHQSGEFLNQSDNEIEIEIENFQPTRIANQQTFKLQENFKNENNLKKPFSGKYNGQFFHDIVAHGGTLSFKTKFHANLQAAEIIWFDEYGEPLVNPLTFDASMLTFWESPFSDFNSSSQSMFKLQPSEQSKSEEQFIETTNLNKVGNGDLVYKLDSAKRISVLTRCATLRRSLVFQNQSANVCPFEVLFYNAQNEVLARNQLSNEVVFSANADTQAATEYMLHQPDWELSQPTKSVILQVPKNAVLMSLKLLSNQSSRKPNKIHLERFLAHVQSSPFNLSREKQWLTQGNSFENYRFERDNIKIESLKDFTDLTPLQGKVLQKHVLFSNAAQLREQLTLHKGDVYNQQEIVPENTPLVEAFVPLASLEQLEVQKFLSSLTEAQHENRYTQGVKKAAADFQIPNIWQKIENANSQSLSYSSLKSTVTGALNWVKFPSGLSGKSVLNFSETSKQNGAAISSESITFKPKFHSSQTQSNTVNSVQESSVNESIFVEGFSKNTEPTFMFKKTTFAKHGQKPLVYRFTKESAHEFVQYQYIPSIQNQSQAETLEIELKHMPKSSSASAQIHMQHTAQSAQVALRSPLIHLRTWQNLKPLSESAKFNLPLFISATEPIIAGSLVGSFFVDEDIPIGDSYEILFRHQNSNSTGLASVSLLQPGQSPRKTMWIESENVFETEASAVSLQEGVKFEPPLEVTQ